MQPRRPGGNERACAFDGIAIVARLLRRIATQEPNAAPFAQVDGRNDRHRTAAGALRAIAMKLSSNKAPVV